MRIPAPETKTIYCGKAVVLLIACICSVSVAKAQSAGKRKPPRPAPRTTLTAREVAKKAMLSVVSVYTTDATGAVTSLGSGFFISGDLVATNYHVIERAVRIYAKTPNQRTMYQVSGVAAADEKMDLAILRIEGAGGIQLELDTVLSPVTTVQLGEVVYAIGTPEGLEGTISQGIVSGIRDLGG